MKRFNNIRPENSAVADKPRDAFVQTTFALYIRDREMVLNSLFRSNAVAVRASIVVSHELLPVVDTSMQDKFLLCSQVTVCYFTKHNSESF